MKQRLPLPGLAIAAMLGWAALGSVPGQAQQTEAKTVLATSFEKDTNGWMTIGDKAKTEVEADTINGNNALRYDYSIEKGNFNLLLLPVNENEIAPAKALRFKVKTDYPTTIAVALQEKLGNTDQGRYVAYFHSPGGTWQDVTLSTSDFVLSRDANEPKDPNNKLDMAQVAAVGLLDWGQLVAQAEDPQLATLLGTRTGAHTLWLRDFKIIDQPLPGASFASGGDERLDTFGYPQVGWITLGGMKLSVHSGKPLEGKGLKASYNIGPGKVAGLVRQLPTAYMKWRDTIQLTLAAEKPTTLLVQVEEQGGGKYNSVVEVPGDAMPKTFKLPLADFTQSDDSKDSNNKLDQEKINQVVLVDISGVLGSARENQPNTLYLGTLRAPLAPK